MKISSSRRLSLLLILCALNAACFSPANDGDAAAESTLFHRYHYTQLHLGVQVRIVVFAEKEALAKTAVQAAFDRIAALEDVFSNYRPKSELNQLITTAYSQPIQASDELFALLQECKSFSKETNGAFDVSLGPLSDAWREARRTGLLPDRTHISRLFQRTGLHHLTLDKSDQTVTIAIPDMQLDLGGIAKGYIMDEALLVLQEHGIQSALLEAGGDIVVGAPPPGKPGWAIEVPDTPANNALAKKAAQLHNAAISTSGDTEQFIEIDGVRYAHIIDPKTGLGATNRKMATVIAPNGMTADKFATALVVMDDALADELLAQHPEVLVYVRKSLEVRESGSLDVEMPKN